MFASKVELKVVGATEPNQYFRHSIDVLKAKWYPFHEIDSDEDNDDEETDMFLESDVTKYTAKGNVGIICTGDDHNYYLAKLITHIHEIEKSEKDDNNHKNHTRTSKITAMPAHQKDIACSYLEVIKI